MNESIMGDGVRRLDKVKVYHISVPSHPIHKSYHFVLKGNQVCLALAKFMLAVSDLLVPFQVHRNRSLNDMPYYLSRY